MPLLLITSERLPTANNARGSADRESIRSYELQITAMVTGLTPCVANNEQPTLNNNFRPPAFRLPIANNNSIFTSVFLLLLVS
jgi:hypothetical protein